jgi:hypothetical protein
MHILDDIFSIKAKTIFGFEGKKGESVGNLVFVILNWKTD